MKEHQIKVSSDELTILTEQSVTRLHYALGNCSTDEMEEALERVNYFTKRHIKNLSGKPDIQTETNTEEAKPSAAVQTEGWN